jgi:hypothetical protein
MIYGVSFGCPAGSVFNKKRIYLTEFDPFLNCLLFSVGAIMPPEMMSLKASSTDISRLVTLSSGTMM